MLRDNDEEIPTAPVLSVLSDGRSLANSDLTATTSSSESFVLIKTLVDAMGNHHSLCKLPIKETMGKHWKIRYTMKRSCKICLANGIRQDVVYFCFECGHDHSYCSIDKFNVDRDCVGEHVMLQRRPSQRRRTGLFD